ncbi:MAG: tetratricopeptide repeat protein [Flavobacteriaceae bacterium]|jgi:tetratricopeptide (TPR) repeat protein|nr:tetratricopeptide repeat protein [Flavobacteriaceae bacterium]
MKEHFKGENHSLGIVYLNYANLLIQTNQLDKAQTYLSKSEKIFKKYFDVSHNNFGDLYLAYGDFYKKKKEDVLSKENYQKALKIYSDKFDENHYKVKSVKQKIK